jgi:hypothetical protein
VSFRAAHLERFGLLKTLVLDADQTRRLAELDGIIEAERERRALRWSLMTALAVRALARPLLKDVGY